MKSEKWLAPKANRAALVIDTSIRLLSLLAIRAGGAMDPIIRMLGSAIAVVAILLTSGVLDQKQDVPLAGIQEAGRTGYLVAINGESFRWWFYSPGDSNSSPKSSPMRLMENGHPIGHPHSNHQSIREQGLGRYSHWAGWLYFSTPDNTDPRSNGRHYAIELPPDPIRVLLLPCVLMFVLLGWRQRHGPAHGLPELRIAAEWISRIKRSRLGGAVIAHRRAGWYMISCAVSAYYVGMYAFGAPGVPIIRSDTGTYWAGSQIVPLGYPVFLWVMYGIFGTLHAAVVAQAVLYAMAAISVQAAVERVTQCGGLGSLAAVALISIGAAPGMAIWLLSESTFTSSLLFHAAAAGYFFASPSRKNMFLLALTAGLAISVRPAGYFLAGGLVLLLVASPYRRIALLKWCVLPFAMGIGLLGAAGTMVHGGGAGGGNLGANLFPHVVSIYSIDSSAASSAVKDALKRTPIPGYQKAVADARSWQERQALEQNNFNEIVRATRLAIIRADPRQNTDKLLHKMALSAIESDPIGYLRIVAENLAAWYGQLLFVNVPSVGLRLSNDYEYGIDLTDQFLRSRGLKHGAFDPSAFLLRDIGGPLIPRKMPQEFIWWLKAVYTVAALAILFAFLFGYRRSATDYLVYVAALAFGAALLVSLSTVFIPRYAIPIDPLVLLVDVLSLWIFLKLVKAALAYTLALRKPMTNCGVGGSTAQARSSETSMSGKEHVGS